MREGTAPEISQSALLIYDMTQNRFTEGERRYLKAAVDGLPDLVRLVGACRSSGVPVCYVVSARAAPDYDVCHAIVPQPGDKIVIHTKTGGFFGTDLEQFLRANGRDTILLAGIALDYGVSSTVREALTLGIHPILVRDACFSYDIPNTPVGPVTREELEHAHLASLHFMGAGIMFISEIISALKPT
ncbi:MAG: isochorismatase hydrolase [Chloroflexi bacterium]|nr:isochorismatase hydrolase [Chloroflexota bacterium]